MWLLNKTTGLQWEVFGAHANDLLKSGHYEEIPETIPVTVPAKETNATNDNGDADSKTKKANRRSNQR